MTNPFGDDCLQPIPWKRIKFQSFMNGDPFDEADAKIFFGFRLHDLIKIYQNLDFPNEVILHRRMFSIQIMVF